MIVVESKFSEVGQRIRSRFRSRGLEWEHSIIASIFGMIIMLNPAVLNNPSFAAFPRQPGIIGAGLFITGVVGIVALCINGYMARPTAIARTAASVIRAVVFGLLSLGYLFSWQWPTALAPYPVIGLFSVFSFFWAILDVAVPDHHADAS